jgi:DNA repair protein RecO (recombination protein O)
MYKTHAIIIGREEMGEADRMLDVLTEYFGRLSVMARGVRKITSKLNAHTQLFNESEIVFVDGKKNKVLTSALKINAFPGITNSLKKIRKINEGAEFVGRLVLHSSPDEERTFRLFRDFLGAIERNNETESDLIMRYFEFGLLGALGFGPEFKRCVFCGSRDGAWRVAFVQGGRICENCVRGEMVEATEISDEARYLVEAVVSGKRPVDKVSKEAIDEAGRLLRFFINYHTNK